MAGPPHLGPSVAEAVGPGVPTPDGRGRAVPIPIDVRNTVVFVDGDRDGSVRRLVTGGGGQIADTVDVNTDYVVAVSGPGDPNVHDRARALHIPVLNPDLSWHHNGGPRPTGQ